VPSGTDALLAAHRGDRLMDDPDVPGLVHPVDRVDQEVVVGDWKFQRLSDGTVLVSCWRGDRMVTHTLFEVDEVAAIAAVVR